MSRALRSLLSLMVAFAFLTLILPVSAAPASAETVLLATLTGGATEVPNAGDPDGNGTAIVTLKPDSNEVCWDILATNITLPAAASHIHEGVAGVAGPVVVPFTAPDATGKSSGCAQADAALITRIGQNPGGFYVNVHTSDFPGGAIRGQLAPGAIPAPLPAPAPAGEIMLATSLAGGSNEVPNPGDPDGSGTATVTLKSATSEVCWDITAMGIALPAAASHIHEGATGVAGPVVVPFSAPDAAGKSTGCAKADAALIARIGQNPDGFYVNVHTSDFPGGAIRGQLSMAATPGAPAPAPVTLPDTGAHDGLNLLAGLAVALLALGLSLSTVARRRISTR